MKKVLVTGAEGFIGKRLLEHCSGYDSYGVDEEYLKVELWEEKIQNALTAFNPHVIFHIGACSNTLESKVNFMMVRNYEATKVIMDWCKKNNAPLIYSSSAANYGINGRYPSNLYGWSKYVAEDYVLQSGGVALRYFNVYGPGESHKGGMASMAYQAHSNYCRTSKPIGLFPKSPKRDFVYIEDIVAANMHAWKNYDTLRGKYYEVGSGTARTFEDMLQIMHIPYFYFDINQIPEGYQFFTCSDKEKWMDGWVPKFDLESGLLEYKKYLDSISSPVVNLKKQTLEI